MRTLLKGDTLAGRMVGDLNEAQRALAQYMSELSEEAYFAGWMGGLEFALWQVALGARSEYGQLVVSQAHISKLIALSQAAGGWIIFDDTLAETWVPLQDWKILFERWQRGGVIRPGERGASGEKRKVLFICSKNQWRSPTAEAVWRKHPELSVRSAGTSSTARRKVSADDIKWADVIFVMEEKHRARLVAEFNSALAHKTLHVLDIPDEYKYMDFELVEQLQEAVAALLGLD